MKVNKDLLVNFKTILSEMTRIIYQKMLTSRLNFVFKGQDVITYFKTTKTNVDRFSSLIKKRKQLLDFLFTRFVKDFFSRVYCV